MMENREKAFDEIRKLINEFPSDPRLYVLMGDLYFDDNQKQNALAYYERARRIDPDFPPLIISMVNFYEQTNDTEAMQTELRRAITGPELDLETKMQFLGEYLNILQRTGQDFEAVNPIFQTLFAQHPYDTELSFVFGSILMMQGDEEKAISYFERFIRENPENSAGYEQLLRIAINNQDLDMLTDISTKALERFPQKPQFYFYLGIAHFQKSRYAKALQVFQAGLQNAVFPHPGLRSMFLGQIGDLHHKLDNQEAAFEYYGKALEYNPMNIHVLNNYAYFLALARRDLQRAEQMSAITLQAEPLNPIFLDTYGWILYQQGAYTLARIYLERAIEHGRDNPSAVIYEQFGDVLYKTGEPERARKMWKRAKELGGDNEFLIRKIETGEYHSKWTDKERE
jgi:tetratricopeptide (TPR) repeat protein